MLFMCMASLLVSFLNSACFMLFSVYNYFNFVLNSYEFYIISLHDIFFISISLWVSCYFCAWYVCVPPNSVSHISVHDITYTPFINVRLFKYYFSAWYCSYSHFLPPCALMIFMCMLSIRLLISDCVCSILYLCIIALNFPS
jgi:hypothetical protein